ncbi:hypothetical protein IC789_13700 [Acinetobacter seifertii]|uniref:SGNH domain-containing protein n=1 Tax=Acinetobacter seifertii TaxID=1530123 RepID=A0A7H2UGJ2_9GAMM|nr:SGNH hydrolase domain-containing protein [Acinetobacter seifertii]MBD1220469.1 hypothetical protein [Acinetobacter seifertii]QNX18664.1 hypothetical protein IC792_13450 [Acinetobacter seifertii]QNX25336.1 hypothetical protein IC791_13510 [Acinetobacter seifertii]QNX36299.1 hypothetical protein IC789_13700 [Acinetobacter seifertii]QNX40125.1 hypothetical protein IC787_13590 [Acinetobacter seifertii]
MNSPCIQANILALDNIKKLKPNYVIIAQQNDHDKTDWNSIINTLNSYGVEKIIIVGAVPQWHPSLPKVKIKDANFYTQSKINDNGLDLKIIEDDAKAEQFVKKLNTPNVKYISLIKQMCDFNENKYFCETNNGDDLLQLDYGHLSKKGSIYVVDKYIKPFI